MDDYVRKITKVLSDSLGKYNVVARYNMVYEHFEIVIKNQFGLATYTVDRDLIEYDFDNAMEDILHDFRFGRTLK